MLSAAIERDYLSASSHRDELLAQAARNRQGAAAQQPNQPGRIWRNRSVHQLGALLITLGCRLQGLSSVATSDPRPLLSQG
jgi:hypothetical protein